MDPSARDDWVIKHGIRIVSGLSRVLVALDVLLENYVYEHWRVPGHEAVDRISVGNSQNEKSTGREPVAKVVEHVFRTFDVLQHVGVVDHIERLGRKQPAIAQVAALEGV